MTVGLDVSSLSDGVGGIPTVAQGLAVGLQEVKGGMPIRLFARKRLESVSLPVEPEYIRPTAFSRALWSSVALGRALRDSDLDIFISPAFATPHWAKFSTITLLLDATPFNGWGKSGIRGAPLRRAARYSLNRSTVPVVNTSAVAGEFVRLGLCSPDRLHVVHLGVSSEFLAVEARPADRIVWAGSAALRKDRKTMEQAAALSGLTYVTLGPGARADHRTTNDVVDLLSGAAALVITSRYEGFSLPVIEARSLGVPVICTDIPCHREVTDPNTTVFFPVGDAEALRKILAARPWEDMPRVRSWTRTWADVARDLLEIGTSANR